MNGEPISVVSTVTSFATSYGASGAVQYLDDAGEISDAS